MAIQRLPTRYMTPDLRNLSGLTAETFNPGELQNPIIGDYGRRAIGTRPVEYRLPAQYSPAVLASMSPGELAQLERQASKAYDQLEQSWRFVIPEGYTGIYTDDENTLSGPDPMAMPENQRRQRALELIRSIRSGAEDAASQQRQGTLRAQNQLAAGLSDAGYELDLRGNAMEELWNNRSNLPGFVKTPGARNFIKRKGEKFAYENIGFSPEDLAKMGVGLRQGDDTGVIGGTTIVDPGGVVRKPGTGLPDPNAMVGRQLDPNAPIGDSPLTNPDDWEPDPTYNPADGRMDMRYRRKRRLAPNTEYPADGYPVTPPKVNRFGAPEGRSLRPRTTMASFGLPTSTRIGV